MIKSGIKNYFANLKFYFVPIGALAVGVIIGLSILLPGTVSAVKTLINNVTAILNETSIDFNEVKNFVIDSVRELDWYNDLLNSVKTVLSREWLTSLFNGCIDLVSADLQPYADQLNNEVNKAVATVTSLFGVLIFFAILGLIGGYFLTSYLVRKNTVKCSLWKYLLSALIDAIIAPVLLIVCIWLFTLWKPSIFFSSLVSLFLFSLTSLLSAHVVYGAKKVGSKQVLNAKNIFKLFAANFIIYYISIAIVVILSLLINVFSGILIGFSFVEIAFLVISINAKSYVSNLLPQKQEQEKQPLAA